MTSCEVLLAYSHLANNKSKRKHTHFEQHTNFYFKLQMPYLLLISMQRTMQGLRNLLNDPRRAGGLTANTPHFMILLINPMYKDLVVY